MDAKVNLNTDGSMRIVNEFTSNGYTFRKTITLSESITVMVESFSASVILFDESIRLDVKSFAIGEYSAAIEWAANRIADFQFLKAR